MDNGKKKLLFIAVLLAGCVLTSVVSDYWGADTGREAALATTGGMSKKAEKGSKKIVVYVSGAVLEPGMYELDAGSRAEDAVAAAGGLTEQADKERVNLARKLKDGNQVNVPAQKQKSSKSSTNTSAVKMKNSSKKSNGNAAPATAVNARININSATVSELQSLPGVGPALAQRIVAYRQGKRFNSVDDLLQVKGIGKAKLERLRAYAEVD